MNGRSEFIFTASRCVCANRRPGKASRAPTYAQTAARPSFTVSFVTGILEEKHWKNIKIYLLANFS